jgi:hypothetical protein
MRNTLMILLMIFNVSCDITSSDVFILQIQDLEGYWYGASKVESSIQPGYYTDRPVAISIIDRDTSTYSLRDTFDLTIQEHISDDQIAITHFGYVTGLEDEYEDFLTGTFHKTDIGGVIQVPIYFSQIHTDSIQIQFLDHEYRVSN